MRAGHAQDLHYMRLALALAANGRGTASPNPMVGAVVVSHGRIVGKGYHLRPGLPRKFAKIVNRCLARDPETAIRRARTCATSFARSLAGTPANRSSIASWVWTPTDIVCGKSDPQTT